MKAFFKGFGIGLFSGLIILTILFGFLFVSGNLSLPASESASEEIEEDTKSVLPEASQPEEPAAEETVSSEEEVFTEEEALPPAPLDVTLAFAGDVMFSDQILASYDQKGICAIADEDMLAQMQGADLFILNEEFPFSLQGEPMSDKQYTFRTDPKYVKIFQELGTDIVTVANNHALDFGQEAFCDTLDTLKEADITCIGGGYNITEASAPAIREIGGQTFAIFGATRVSPSYDWYATDSQPGLFQTYDPAKLNAAIQEASAVYDHVIVFVHWGIERNETPEEYQRTLAKGYIDAGADLIVGCHPHVLQGFEYYNGAPIIYSLGNYLFGNRDGETLLLNAVFSPEDGVDIRLIPCKRQNSVLRRIQQPESLYRHLTELSFGVTVDEDGVLRPTE